jgi:hypothetical protein
MTAQTYKDSVIFQNVFITVEICSPEPDNCLLRDSLRCGSRSVKAHRE